MAMTTPSKNRAKEICELHDGIVQSMRRSVADAIRIGELLTEEKAGCEHGAFLPWIEREMPFDVRSAQRYMGLWRYRNECDSVSYLQDAYRKVEQIEDQAKQQERQRKDQMIAEKQATGKKPEGWDRSCDREEMKRQDDAAFEERKRRANEEKQREYERPAEEPAQGKSKWDQIYDAIMATPPEKNADLKLDDIRANVQQKGMFAALQEYVDGFAGVSRQLEAVHNLMRYLTRLGAVLQTKTQEAGA